MAKKKVAKKKSAKKARRGRPSTLTKKIREQLETCWGLPGVSDAEICESIGITHDQLKAWLQRNDDLRHLRTRKKASVKISYLRRLLSLIDKLEDAGDFDGAARHLCWLMSKQYPRDFGSISQVEIDDGQKIIRLPFGLPENFAFRKDTG